MRITEHCDSRLSRLGDIVTLKEVSASVAQFSPKVGETWVLVKRLKRSVYIVCNTTDGGVNGDTVWAVVKRRPQESEGVVVTIMLRRWEQGVPRHVRRYVR